MEVLDDAPAELNAPQMVVLLVLAEALRDDTRQGFIKMIDLARRARCAPSSARRTVGELVAAGLVHRMPVGFDRNGAPVYAHRGHATVYYMPPFRPEVETGEVPVRRRLPEQVEPVDNSPPKGSKALAGEHLPTEKGAHPHPERRSKSARKALTSEHPPLTTSTQKRSHPPREADPKLSTAVVAELRERTGRTVDEQHAAGVVRQILGDATGTVRRPEPYVIAAIRRDPDPSRFLSTPTPPRYQRPDDSRDLAAPHERTPR